MRAGYDERVHSRSPLLTNGSHNEAFPSHGVPLSSRVPTTFRVRGEVLDSVLVPGRHRNIREDAVVDNTLTAEHKDSLAKCQQHVWRGPVQGSSRKMKVIFVDIIVYVFEPVVE